MIRKYINSLIIILMVSSTVLLPVSANDNGLAGVAWDRSVEGEITQILTSPRGEQVLITTDEGYVYRFDEAGEINLPNNEPLRVSNGPIDKIVANTDLGRFGYLYKNDTHSIAALPILESDYYYIESDVYDLGIDCDNNGDFWVVVASEPGEDKSYLGIFTSSGRGGWIVIDAIEPSSIVLDKTNINYLVGISTSNDKELISIDLEQIPSEDDLEELSNLAHLHDLIPAPYLQHYSLEMLPQADTTNLIFDINTDGDIDFFEPYSLKAWGRDNYRQVSAIPDGLKAVQIAAGEVHSLALTPQGDVVAWGRNNYGQVSAIPDGLKAAQISSRYCHNVALTPEGDVVAWGRDVDGQVSDIPDGLKAIQVAAGNHHNLAITTDGDVVAWGNDEDGQVSDIPDGLKATQVAAGAYHNLAITPEGDVVAWGWDEYGQVSDIPDGLKATQVACGNFHSVAITPEGDVVAWGQDNYGQISGIPDGLKAVQIAAGNSHNLALTPEGDVVAWGRDDYGQVFNIPDGLKATQVAAGNLHSLALYSVDSYEPANLKAWGRDDDGEVSDIPDGLKATQVASGNYHILAITPDGDVVAWGWDDYGQVSGMPDGLKAVQIAAGHSHNLVITPEGDVVAWRRDDDGQVSDIPDGLKATQVAAGYGHSLALTPDGDVVGWGRDEDGQVSDIPDGLKAVQIAAGSHHSLVITPEGDVVGWGRDEDGQVSDIPDGLKATQVAAGAYHNLAITTDGDVVGWGRDDNGQVSGIPSGLKAVQIAAGYDHSLAITPYGNVVAWGRNTFGQVSDIPDGLKATQVAAGNYHSLALYPFGSDEPFNIKPFSNITNLQFYDDNIDLLNHEISGDRITVEIPPDTHNINIVVHNPDYEAIITDISFSPIYLDYNYLDLFPRPVTISLHNISLQTSTKTLSNAIKSIYKPLHGDILIIQTDIDTIYQPISGYKLIAETTMQGIVGLPTSVAASQDGNNIIEGRDLVVNIYTGSDGIKRGTYTAGGKILDVSMSEQTGLYAVATAEDGKIYIFSKDTASAWYLLYSSQSLQPVAQICSMASYANIVSYARSNTLYYFSMSEAAPIDGNIKLSIFHKNRPYENKDVWYEQGGRNKEWSRPERVTTDSYGVCYIPIVWGEYVRVTVGDGELEKIIVANPQQTEYILRVIGDVPLRTGAKYFATYESDQNIIWFYYEDTKFKTHRLHLQMIRLSDNVVVVDEWFTTPDEFPVSYEYQIPDGHDNTNYKINMNCYGSPTYKNTWQVWVGTDGITALPDTIPDAVKTGMWFILILFVAGLFTYLTGPQGAVVVSLMTGFLVLIKWLPLSPSIVGIAIVWAFIGLFGRGGTD